MAACMHVDILPFILVSRRPPLKKGSGESLYIEVWRCWNAGGTNQIAAVVQS